MKRIVFLLALCFEFCAAPIFQSQEEQVGVRLIAVKTAEEAAGLRVKIQNGSPFEELAKAHSVGPSANTGGYIGFLRLSDLRPEFQKALEGVKPGQVSAVTPVDGEFLLLQRLSLEEAGWIPLNDAGVQAFDAARYDAAVENFQKALQYAEKLTPVDYRLEDTLHGLAESYRLQKKYTEAEPIYRRYLATHWGGPGVPEVLDQFSALLALSYFRDSQFADTLGKFQQTLDRAPLSEELYQGMSGILFKANLIPEAQAVMARAATLFPESRDVQYYHAQLYRNSLNPRKALELFERLSRVKSAGDDLDRLQQSVVYQKIGSVHAELVEFDEAASAYKKALEILPNSAESRLGLGDIYLQQGKPEEALAEYNRVVQADPKNAAAHFRVADTSLRMGNFDAAAAAASRALAIDPGHRRAHYVLATALVRTGGREKAEQELETYRKLEAETRSDFDRGRSIIVLNNGAAAKVLEGRPEEAVALFQKAIEAYPDSPAAYLNLGITQSKLGRHKDAVETFQKMLSLGMDNFMVYRNLSHEYELLGDMEASRRHRVVYFQNLDLALREAVESNFE